MRKTKVKILVDNPQNVKKKKPIQAIVCIQSISGFIAKDWLSFDQYDLSRSEELNIIKVKGYVNFDCIIIDKRGNIFLGYFNDGIVE